MDVTALGRYSPYPPVGGACPSYLVKSGDVSILLDCGSGAASRFLEFCSWDKLSCVILSHLHGDHVSDMLVARYAVWESQRLGRRALPLTVYCPGEPLYEREHLDYKGAYRIVPVTANDTLQIGEVKVRLAPTVHSYPGFSVRLEAGGRSLVYTGDTEPNPALDALTQRADLLLCDTTFTEARKGQSHHSAREAGMLAQRAGVGKLLLTHFSTAFPVEDAVAEARGVFAGVSAIEERTTYTV